LDKTYYRVIKNGKIIPVIPKATITVLKSSRIGLKVEYSGSVYDVEVLDEPPKKEPKIKKQTKKHKPVKPAQDHPWRTKSSQYAALFYEESDREILEALYSSRLAWR